MAPAATDPPSDQFIVPPLPRTREASDDWLAAYATITLPEPSRQNHCQSAHPPARSGRAGSPPTWQPRIRPARATRLRTPPAIQGAPQTPQVSGAAPGPPTLVTQVDLLTRGRLPAAMSTKVPVTVESVTFTRPDSATPLPALFVITESLTLMVD